MISLNISSTAASIFSPFRICRRRLYMAVLCWFMTSSYSSKCLRISKLCPSTLRCAPSMARDDHSGGDRLVFRHLQRVHDLLNAFTVKNAHEIVFERKVKPRFPRIALPARAATQLVIDPARFVALSAHDVKTAGGDDLPLFPLHSGTGTFCSALRVALESFQRRASDLAKNSGLPPSRMSVPRPAMLVAIVDPAASGPLAR